MTENKNSDWQEIIKKQQEESEPELLTNPEGIGSFIPDEHEEAKESQRNFELMQFKTEQEWKMAVLQILMQISKSLNDIAHPKSIIIPTSTENMSSIEKVKSTFTPDLLAKLDFEDYPQEIIIKARGWLGSDYFGKILAIVKENGGSYISQGKNSHFKIKK